MAMFVSAVGGQAYCSSAVPYRADLPAAAISRHAVQIPPRDQSVARRCKATAAFSAGFSPSAKRGHRGNKHGQFRRNTIRQMAVNVFGVVVDDAMLQELGIMNPTKATRAKFAWRFINDDNKKDRALAYVRNLKDMYGNGSSTLCLVYNATGDAIRYANSHSWMSGSLYNVEFPEEIGNGQWAAFLHVHKSGAPSGSIGAVVYRGKIKNGQDRDFLICWDTPWSMAETNKAHCDIGAVNFTDGRWEEIYNQLDNHSTYYSKSSADGTDLEANTETGSSPTFTATIKQE